MKNVLLPGGLVNSSSSYQVFAVPFTYINSSHMLIVFLISRIQYKLTGH